MKKWFIIGFISLALFLVSGAYLFGFISRPDIPPGDSAIEIIKRPFQEQWQPIAEEAVKVEEVEEESPRERIVAAEIVVVPPPGLSATVLAWLSAVGTFVGGIGAFIGSVAVLIKKRSKA